MAVKITIRGVPEAVRDDAPLATLDRRLQRASGPRCRFLTRG
jgi:hypothetical protein